ncbi:hypothetical protein JHK84_035563 [Glycine max]|nr:hypothetical protein JHK87_035096 [Glycine soja]KAG4969462.1 hypothetical protein JHK85_035883 [Glycine max]KAG4975814.1 hypothetical protein JHK86_035288 [Glycine max]KAG5129166.1 hypothetical protein JHK84_035563 [Glycine max]
MIPPHPKNGKSGKVSNNVKEGQMDPGPIMVNNIPMRHQMENIQAVQGLPMMNGDGGYYQGLRSARSFRLNGAYQERGSPNGTYEASAGCSLHKNILHQDEEASRIWAS